MRRRARGSAARRRRDPRSFRTSAALTRGSRAPARARPRAGSRRSGSGSRRRARGRSCPPACATAAVAARLATMSYSAMSMPAMTAAIGPGSPDCRRSTLLTRSRASRRRPARQTPGRRAPARTLRTAGARDDGCRSAGSCTRFRPILRRHPRRTVDQQLTTFLIVAIGVSTARPSGVSSGTGAMLRTATGDCGRIRRERLHRAATGEWRPAAMRAIE